MVQWQEKQSFQNFRKCDISYYLQTNVFGPVQGGRYEEFKYQGRFSKENIREDTTFYMRHRRWQAISSLSRHIQWTLVIVNSVCHKFCLLMRGVYYSACSLCYKTIGVCTKKCLLMRDCLLFRRLLLPESTVPVPFQRNNRFNQFLAGA